VLLSSLVLAQKPDPVTKILPYRSAVQTITTIAKTEGVLTLWSGFPPYYIRCGGHTVLMFMSVAWLRKQYQKMQEK
jgi:solute carrier family 25 oxoglutarate transporter 11